MDQIQDGVQFEGSISICLRASLEYVYHLAVYCEGLKIRNIWELKNFKVTIKENSVLWCCLNFAFFKVISLLFWTITKKKRLSKKVFIIYVCVHMFIIFYMFVHTKNIFKKCKHKQTIINYFTICSTFACFFFNLHGGVKCFIWIIKKYKRNPI